MNIQVPQLCIITGYYGVGKTNLSLNLARTAAASLAADATSTSIDKATESAHNQKVVTLIDLDIINPYFRSSDYAEKLQDERIKMIIPAFARTGLETPALSAAINGALESKGTVIVDVGGDDAGATTLARYNSDIKRRLSRTDTAEYALWYVVNRNRSTTESLDAAIAETLWQLREIEKACKLKITGIINNTHLQEETGLETILEGICFADRLARDAGLPLVATTIPRTLLEQAATNPKLAELQASGQLQPVEHLVTTPWQ